MNSKNFDELVEAYRPELAHLTVKNEGETIIISDTKDGKTIELDKAQAISLAKLMDIFHRA